MFHGGATTASGGWLGNLIRRGDAISGRYERISEARCFFSDQRSKVNVNGLFPNEISWVRCRVRTAPKRMLRAPCYAQPKPRYRKWIDGAIFGNGKKEIWEISPLPLHGRLCSSDHGLTPVGFSIPVRRPKSSSTLTVTACEVWTVTI